VFNNKEDNNSYLDKLIIYITINLFGCFHIQICTFMKFFSFDFTQTSYQIKTINVNGDI